VALRYTDDSTIPVMARITTTHAVADRNRRVASELPCIRTMIPKGMSSGQDPMDGCRFSDKIIFEQKSTDSWRINPLDQCRSMAASAR